jgi:hypothetical protein
VNSHKDAVEVWEASFMTSKVVRLQFRTKKQLQAAENVMRGNKKLREQGKGNETTASN